MVSCIGGFPRMIRRSPATRLAECCWPRENGSQPDSSLLDSWKDYIGALKASIDETSFNQLKTTIMGRAQEVASAAGGILGLGSTSNAESEVMKDLESAFGV